MPLPWDSLTDSCPRESIHQCILQVDREEVVVLDVVVVADLTIVFLAIVRFLVKVSKLPEDRIKELLESLRMLLRAPLVLNCIHPVKRSR